jgi:hypothetical protein
MISAGIIAIMLMVIIYFVVRSQGLQREIKQANNASKASSRALKLTQKQLVLMSSELQRIFLTRLENQNKRGLIGQDSYQIAFFILKHFDFVVMNCAEHGSTVEEAVNKALRNQAVKLENINEYIKVQPNDIRIAWCQNSLEGFIAACRGISAGVIKTEAADTGEPAETAS